MIVLSLQRKNPPSTGTDVDIIIPAALKEENPSFPTRFSSDWRSEGAHFFSPSFRVLFFPLSKVSISHDSFAVVILSSIKLSCIYKRILYFERKKGKKKNVKKIPPADRSADFPPKLRGSEKKEENKRQQHHIMVFLFYLFFFLFFLYIYIFPRGWVKCWST